MTSSGIIDDVKNDEYKDIIILLCSMLTVYVQKHCSFLILYIYLNIITVSSQLSILHS